MKSVITFLLVALVIFAVVYLKPGYRGGYGARTSAALADIHGGIKTALGRYKIDNGFYPKNFGDLIQKPSDATKWSGPYLDQLPTDPWGDNYIYEFPGKHNPSSYDLLSVGPDGKEGTEDDIGNW